MNFLAHLYLSGNHDDLRVGNFIGDFVKGKNLRERFAPGIVKGIELHREIDDYTDHHRIVQESKNRLRPKYRHYSAVIVDVFYDHFLARRWDEFSDEILPDFADRSYELLQRHLHVLPEAVNYMLPHMIRGNWLVNYARLEGIDRALSGMARRTSFVSKMEEAAKDLEKDYEEFEAEFRRFFPELTSFTKEWITKNSFE